MKRKVVIIFAVLVVFTVLINACSGGESKFYGKWEGSGEEVEFFKDGSCTVTMLNSSTPLYTWSVEDKSRVRLGYDSFEYKFSDGNNELTLTRDSGKVYIFEKTR